MAPPEKKKKSGSVPLAGWRARLLYIVRGSEVLIIGILTL